MKISKAISLQEALSDQQRRVGSKKSVQQGRLLPGSSRRAPPLFCARNVLALRERSRREERSRLVRPPRRDRCCEPEGPANGENAAGAEIHGGKPVSIDSLLFLTNMKIDYVCCDK